jgi:5-methylthioadenosine/S-adenosylhomocysteine deaminase
MTLFRGVADDFPLDNWLREEIWPIEAGLEGKHVYAGSLLGCLEMIRTGTTCFNDMYFFVDEIARAVEESGLRGVLSWAMIDAGDAEKGRRLAEEGERLVKRYLQGENKREGRISLFFGPHAPYTCSEELLIKTKELANKYKTGIHIHVAETKREVEESIKEKGKRPLEYLDKIEFLGGNIVAAHTTWVSKKEIEIMKKRNVKVAHNPISNMKLASGTARVSEYIEQGIVVSLGTDGPASNNTLDMFEDMKTCALLHKLNKGDPSVIPAHQVLEFATINGAKALGMDSEIGSLEVGKKADIILVDLEAPNLTPLTNPVSHLVYAAKGCNVSDVLVDGKILMENRQLRTLELGDVLNFASEQAKNLLDKAGKTDRLF